MSLDYSGIIINLLSTVVEKIIKLGADRTKYELAVAKILKKANLLNLEDTYHSIYLHTILRLLDGGLDISWVKIFGFKEFLEEFQRQKYNLVEKQIFVDLVNTLIIYRVAQNNVLLSLFNDRPSEADIVQRIERLAKVFEEISNFAMSPSMQRIYNTALEQRLQIEDLKKEVSTINKNFQVIQEENVRKSFEYQIKQYQNRLIQKFELDFSNCEHYVPVSGIVNQEFVHSSIRQKLNERVDLIHLSTHGSIGIESQNSLAVNDTSDYEEEDDLDLYDLTTSRTIVEPSTLETPASSFKIEWEDDNSIRFSPLDFYFNSWLADATSNLLILVGEYGTGKTTFSRYAIHQLASGLVEDNTGLSIHDSKERRRIPIYLPLYNFEDKVSSFVISTLNTEGVTDISFAEFQDKVKNGELILFLDGFDEMGHTMGYDNKFNNFKKLQKLVTLSDKSKVVLTTRREYFRSKSEMYHILDVENNENYAVIHTCYFDSEQLKQYLSNKVPVDTRRYLRVINSTYDLLDLAKRPVLLDFIVKYLPKILKEKNRNEDFEDKLEITASDLYTFAIKSELNRKIDVEEKFRPFLGKKVRMKILEDLAVWLYHDGQSLTFQLSEFKQVDKIRSHFENEIGKSILESEFENLLNRFLSFSFLIREGDHKFRISHKSFRDFIVAQALLGEISAKKYNEFGRSRLSEAIIYFIAEQIQELEELKRIAQNGDGRSLIEQFSGSNAISIIIQKDKNLLTSLSLRGAKFSEIDFSDVDLSGTDLSNCELIKCKFNHTFLNSMLLETDCQESVLDASNSPIRDLTKLSNITSISIVNLENTRVSDVSILLQIDHLKTVVLSGTSVPNPIDVIHPLEHKGVRVVHDFAGENPEWLAKLVENESYFHEIKSRVIFKLGRKYVAEESYSDLEDVFSDAVISIYNQRLKLRIDEITIENFLISICKRLIIKRRSKESYIHYIGDVNDFDRMGIADNKFVTYGEDIWGRVSAFIKISEKLLTNRELLILNHIMERVSTKTTAEQLHIKEGMVRVLKYRLRKKLRKLWLRIEAIT